eukprot:TRINITY_DN3411_c0_g1_i4.p1 TRINITY_DN3411_c0_g1~~TRINITY_DN3411_c0_g1_i4.p1  ORF type:complete len:368 (+),score=78.23 TRINITY_DN3411_c0_g1_i4:155-1258(+)
MQEATVTLRVSSRRTAACEREARAFLRCCGVPPCCVVLRRDAAAGTAVVVTFAGAELPWCDGADAEGSDLAAALRRAFGERPAQWMWQWLDVDKVWKPFTFQQCCQLTAAYVRFREAYPLASAVVPLLVASLDNCRRKLKLCVDFASMRQINSRTKTRRPIRRLGGPCFVFPDCSPCGLGLAYLPEQSPALKPPPSNAANMLSLPDTVLVTVLCFCVRFCKCTCHSGQFFGDEVAQTLCSVSLVCRRFSQPVPAFSGLTVPEEAARLLCAQLKRPQQFASWREQLLFNDKKVQVRYEARKRQLYRVAFGLVRGVTVPRDFSHPVEQRNVAKAEILRRWHKIDNFLIRTVHTHTKTNEVAIDCKLVQQ